MGHYAMEAVPPTSLTDWEQQAILKTTGEHARGFRDHMLFALAMGLGLRECELVGLNVDDIYSAGGTPKRVVVLKVYKRPPKRKGQPRPAMPLKRRLVFVSERLRAKLKRFLIFKVKRGESLEPGAPLFVSRLGRRLSKSRVRELFPLWQKRAGFERRLNFHSLRHTFCQNARRQASDLRVVQRLARHAKLSTTQQYTEPSDQELLDTAQLLVC